jgi:hypothetical protein
MPSEPPKKKLLVHPSELKSYCGDSQRECEHYHAFSCTRFGHPLSDRSKAEYPFRTGQCREAFRD